MHFMRQMFTEEVFIFIQMQLTKWEKQCHFSFFGVSSKTQPEETYLGLSKKTENNLDTFNTVVCVQ